MLSLHSLPTIFLTLSLLCLSLGSSQSPSLVINIFRHGARGPLSKTIDPTWDPELYGQLTPVGMRMQYLLGKALSKRYPNLLQKAYDRKKVYVRSSQTDRCLDSATSQLFGAFLGSGPSLDADYPQSLAVPPFDPELIQELISDINTTQAIPGGFVPIVINSVPREVDIVLQTPGTCPGLFLDATKNLVNVKSLNLWFNTLAKTRQTLEAAGIQVGNPLKMGEVGDTLYCDVIQDKSLPANITVGSDLYRDVTFAGVWFLTLAEYSSDRQKQLLSVPLFDQVMNFLDAKVNGTTDVEFVFLSTHDSTLMTILTALDIVNEDCLMQNYVSQKAGKPLPFPNCEYPVFASTLLFEYYDNSTIPHVVFRYNDAAIPLCGGNVECSYPDFKALVQNVTNGYTVQDYKEKCLNEAVYDVETIIKMIERLFGDDDDYPYLMSLLE